MDDVIEIDLRKIINNLIAGWKWIAAITLLAGIGTFLFSFLQPRTYSATAMIVITPPRALLYADQQSQMVNLAQKSNYNLPSNTAISSLAMSDEIVQSLYQVWNSATKESMPLSQFRASFLKADAGSDPTVVKLTVKSPSSEMASKLANNWAQSTITTANRLYTGLNESSSDNFQAQLDSARQNLQVTEKALSDFESRDLASVRNNELSSLLTQQADWLYKQRLIEDTTRDVEGLIAQSNSLADDQPIPASMQTNLMVMQLKVYNNLVSAANTAYTEAAPGDSTNTNNIARAFASQTYVSPLQILLPDQNGLRPLSKADFVSSAQGWIDNLKAQSEEIQGSLGQLSSQITMLQEQIRELNNEKERLMLDYKNSQDMYSKLTKHDNEIKTYSADFYNSIQLASGASTPDKPDSRNTVRNTALMLVIGFILSIGFVLILNWWRPKS